eukprot:TRINITY_DN6093_c0_g1_i1.p1 TRINITY_DN6093_c0_g1~~TRINITY_DN6093_c0_g1_i1.p1  ORF type:complete len:146 (-),score=2.57 TRINITY_DN6093_c0_g1_i1:563-1000(-)
MIPRFSFILKSQAKVYPKYTNYLSNTPYRSFKVRFANNTSARWLSTNLPSVPPTELFGQQGSQADYTCWFCRKSTRHSSFFCDQCEAVQPNSCMNCNFFEYFSCPEDFTLSLSELQQKFRNLQRKLHPDKFHIKSEVDHIDTSSY